MKLKALVLVALLPGMMSGVRLSRSIDPVVEGLMSGNKMSGLFLDVVENIKLLNTLATQGAAATKKKKALDKNIAKAKAKGFGGIGMIPKSGYGLRPDYQQYDVVNKFGVKLATEVQMPHGCKCDQVLIGKITPKECPLFNTTCTPRHPIGPCMVSHEGSCKIAFLFQSPD